MTGALVLALASALVAAGVAGRRNERRHRQEAATTVELQVDDTGVRRRLGDGREEAVDWVEITEVEVFTTARGVHADDGVVLVLFGDETRGCLVPSRLAVAHGVVERLHALPGFDGRRLVAAMEADPPSRASVWQRADH